MTSLLKYQAALSAAFLLFLVVSVQGDLVSYWPLDGDATAVVGTDGTLVAGPVAAVDRFGTAGGAMAFNGASSQYISVPGGGGLNSISAATVSMWVQWNGTQDNGYSNRHGAVLGRQKNGTFSNNVLTLYNTSDPNTSNINWETRLGSGMNSGVSPGDGTWRHIAVTVSPAGETLYVDGTPTASRATVGGFQNDASIPLTIGAWIGDGGSYSTSTIDDVVVWTSVLSPEHIASLAAGTIAVEAIRPVGARASSELTGPHNRREGNMVDGVGQATTSTNDWPGNPGGMWLSASGDNTPTVSFDLGGVHELDAMELYNYNEPALVSRGVDQVDVSYSTDNVTYTPLGTMSFNPATGNSSNPGQFETLGGIQARYVKFDVLSNHGDASYTGLNEVEFYGTPQEALPIGGVTATSTGDLYSGGFDRRAFHLVDATGLFAGTHSTSPDSRMWLSDGLGFGGDPGDDGDPELVFDLGATYDLGEVQIWNYNEINFLGRGVDEMEIFASTDGATYDSLGIFALAQAPGLSTVDFSETFLIDAQDAQFIKFDILSNHNGVNFPATGGADNAFVGLSEVRFFEIAAAVPEPSMFLLGALGLLGLTAIAWRRKR